MTVLETIIAVHRKDKPPSASFLIIARTFLVSDFAAWARDSAARRLGDQAAAAEPGAAQGLGRGLGQYSSMKYLSFVLMGRWG